MSIELVKALLMIARVCAAAIDCDRCPLKEFCGKMPSEWWFLVAAAMRSNFRKGKVLADFGLKSRRAEPGFLFLKMDKNSDRPQMGVAAGFCINIQFSEYSYILFVILHKNKKSQNNAW